MSAENMKSTQRDRMMHGRGFIAALDQSGGSTPKALTAYGYQANDWRDEDDMFALVHEMRCRFMRAPSFKSGSILGAILFEKTLLGQVDGLPTAQYLWEKAEVIPFLKIDAGLAELESGVQQMKPMPRLSELLALANRHDVYGTKMRSVIHELNPAGIEAVVAQQFDVAQRVLDAGLVPIIEPEVNIKAEDRAAIEDLLAAQLMDHLNQLSDQQEVILKLSLPKLPNSYAALRDHAAVQRLVALSGGFARREACQHLAKNDGMIASFSRALLEGLSANQSDEDFNQGLNKIIEQVVAASR